MNQISLAAARDAFAPGIFNGRVILVTGAGRGIGKLLAERLAELGARVALCDLVEERAVETARIITDANGEALPLVADVSKEDDVRAAVDAVLVRWGRIDVLVNMAGSYGAAYRVTHETPVDEWDSVFASNVRGSFLCAKTVLPHMIEAGGGRIINFASNAGRSVSPLLGCSYTAAKTAVIGMTRHLSREYARHGILVNTIAPGPVSGERVSGLLRNDEEGRALNGQIPIGRLAESADIVDVVLFMASDASRYMTGAILDVSGGLILA
ncbi:MAG: SDR family oxidoreductase [Bosea sp.]|uniref:SDR family NAD(P)-dependent oxidoreductase n=1 Tax=Bosea sp. (in: a-proteobacteria) TaxID=1871050 RepID=UPI001AC6CD95|nr:SDR family NAD(P)-dependent oxidoreductase [Bosea sp. (in: a-proteobacteria)]MBN9451766.1 SDR family oxidoreductase [Bosea sp. (in: a-proteobacteria)]